MTQRTLDGPPGTFGLYGRAALGSLPLAGRLPFDPVLVGME